MKMFLSAACVAIAMAAAPTTAFAQDTTPQIVVTGKYKKDWEKGSKLEADGLKDLANAKADLVKYSADVVDAQNKRDSSDARGQNSAEDFRRLTENMPYFSNGKDAEKWAKDVEKAASAWAKFEERGGDGAKDFDKSAKRQADARDAVNKAQAKVDKGRAMKREAELRSASQ